MHVLCMFPSDLPSFPASECFYLGFGGFIRIGLIISFFGQLDLERGEVFLPNRS